MTIKAVEYMGNGKEALDRVQLYCAPPAPTKTDSTTTQLATNLKLNLFIVTSLVWSAMGTLWCSLLVGIPPNIRTAFSVTWILWYSRLIELSVFSLQCFL